LLNPSPAAATQTLAAAASAAQSATDSILPQSVRELPSNVVNTFSDIVGQATGVVSGLVEAVTDASTPEDEPKRARSASTKKGTSTTKRAASARSKKSTADKPTTEG